jgi:hypothetical protein
MRDFVEASVKHVRCSGNEAAHKLAKDGCANKVCNAWVGCAPACIANLLIGDVVE